MPGTVVFLCTENTIDSFFRNYKRFEIYLSPEKVVIIGKRSLKKQLDEKSPKVCFIDEDSLYEGMTFSSVRSLIAKITDNDEAAINRSGWYFQQFLKMAYCMKCENANYLVWDSDTVPVHEISMVNRVTGAYYFDIKTEFHKEYFDTMSKLIPKLRKTTDFSYISEHMIFDVNIMKELIEQIMLNADIQGTAFWEKILYAIEPAVIRGSGFSEFETYGTYVNVFYNSRYENRVWKSLREGTIFFGEKGELSDTQLRMLSSEYDAVSFEKHNLHIKLSKIMNNQLFQNMFMIKLFQKAKDFVK